MGKQVEVPSSPIPTRLTLQVGDVARFWATGGHVQEGEGVVTVAGPYLRTTLHDAGRGPRPSGLPNTVQVEARQLGRAILKLFTAAGMLGQALQTHEVEITVKAAP